MHQTPDRLAQIFAMQAELDARVGNDHQHADDPATQQLWLQRLVCAMQHELVELEDSTQWKWWSKYQEFNPQNVKVEIIDLLHFLVSMALEMGMTADDFFATYEKKMAVNHQRQDSGYTVKDENDCAHI